MSTPGVDMGIGGYNIYDDKEKRKKQNKQAQNNLQLAPKVTNTLANRNSGGASSAVSSNKKKSSSPNITSGVFDSIKLPYEDTVAQKNAQKAADLKRQQEKYNAEKLAQKQAAEAKAAQEKYAREKYIAQMRQQQRDGQLKGTGMQSNAVRSNPFTPAVPKLNYTPGRMEVRSAVTQSQWNKGVSGRNNSTNSNVLKTTAPKTTKAEQDAFINKYLPKLMGTESTSRSGYGPNREMANAVKTNPQKNTVPKNATASTQTPKPAGPSAEMTKAVKLEGNPQSFYIATENMLADMVSGIGPSRETSLSYPYGEKGIDFAKERYNLKYGTDGIKEVNHTNTYVTKDMRPETVVKNVESNLKKAQQKLDKIAIDKKDELNNLEFQKYMLLANGYDNRDTADINRQIETAKADMKMIDVRNKKIAMCYELCRKDAEILSQMDEDDILGYIKENDYNPSYSGQFAKTARASNQLVSNTKTVVDTVNSLNVKYSDKKNLFTIGDITKPNSSFEFRTNEIAKTPSLYEHKIIVDKSQMKNLDDLQKDLLKALDGKVISDETHKILKTLADESDALKKAGKNLGWAGVGLDILDFAIIVDSDFKDDGKLGTDTAQEFFGTAASWAGDYVGGVAGAKVGAAIGTVFGPVGTVIGTALGAFAGAYLLSSVMEDAGRYVGENINASNYTIDRYHQRAK